MRILLIAVGLLMCSIAPAQDDIVRLPGEKADQLVKRFFKTAEDSASLHDSTLSFALAHQVVEVSFGEGQQPKIVTCFRMNGSWGICTGVFVPDQNNRYDFFYQGGQPFGIAPDMDSIMSLFTCDRDGDGRKELMVLCQGGQKVVHDGLMGCCDPFYFTDIYTFGKNNFEEVEGYEYEGMNTAAKVKAAITKALHPEKAKPKKSPKIPAKKR